MSDKMVDNKTRTEYAILRKKMPYLSAGRALLIARAKYKQQESEWEWSHNGDTATLEREGFTVTLKVEPDYDPDSSWLGTFGDSFEDGAISNAGSNERHAYKWFYPEVKQSDHREGLSGMGMSKSVAEDIARGYVRRDMEMAREYRAYVLIVTASRASVDLGFDSLGGVDFSDDEPNERQAEEVVDDHGMVDTAIEQARATLAKLVDVSA